MLRYPSIWTEFLLVSQRYNSNTNQSSKLKTQILEMAYPLLDPHSPNRFHPSLVTRRSYAYFSPHTFLDFT